MTNISCTITIHSEHSKYTVVIPSSVLISHSSSMSQRIEGKQYSYFFSIPNVPHEFIVNFFNKLTNTSGSSSVVLTENEDKFNKIISDATGISLVPINQSQTNASTKVCSCLTNTIKSLISHMGKVDPTSSSLSSSSIPPTRSTYIKKLASHIGSLVSSLSIFTFDDDKIITVLQSMKYNTIFPIRHRLHMINSFWCYVIRNGSDMEVWNNNRVVYRYDTYKEVGMYGKTFWHLAGDKIKMINMTTGELIKTIEVTGKNIRFHGNNMYFIQDNILKKLDTTDELLINLTHDVSSYYKTCDNVIWVTKKNELINLTQDKTIFTFDKNVEVKCVIKNVVLVKDSDGSYYLHNAVNNKNVKLSDAKNVYCNEKSQLLVIIQSSSVRIFNPITKYYMRASEQ